MSKEGKGVLDEKERERLRKEAEKGQAEFLDEDEEIKKLKQEIEEIKRKAGKKVEEAWDEVEPELPNIWQPAKVGDELAGRVVEVREGTYGIEAVIEREDGEEITTPAHKLLQSRLENVEVNDQVRIVYQGTVKTGTGRKAEDYKLFRRR